MPYRAAIDVLFLGVNGVDAIYTPAGGEARPDPVRVILSQPDIVTPVYDLSLVSASTQIEVRVSEVRALASGDRLALTDGTVLTVNGKPRRDDTRLIWIAGATES